MDDTPEMIRQQMEETKSQLTEKLETLEAQVTETVQATGNVVTATVDAVQETVDSVTGAVENAVQSVGDVFDMRSHLDKHPWLVLGGAAVMGYLAAEGLTGPRDNRSVRNGASVPQYLPTNGACNGNGTHGTEPAETAAALAAAYESGRESLPLQQLKSVAIGTLIGIVQGVASRAVPQVLDYLAGSPTAATTPYAGASSAEQG